MRTPVAVVLVLLVVSPALSFPTGAPPEACSTVTAGHLNRPQTLTSPYSIDLSVFDDGSGGFRYLPGMTYKCELNKCPLYISHPLPTYVPRAVEGKSKNMGSVIQRNVYPSQQYWWTCRQPCHKCHIPELELKAAGYRCR